MGSLSLNLSNPQIVWRFGKGTWMSPGWALSWTVAFDSLFHSVEVASGGDLADMPGSLTLRVGQMDSEPEREEDKELLSFERGEEPIGTITFIPAYDGSEDGVVRAQPDAWEATLLITEEDLHELIDQVSRGHGPRNVRLSVPGFRYGWAPDGSHQTWNNTVRQWTKVDGATFIFCEEKRETCDDEEASPAGEATPPPLSAETQAIYALRQQITAFGRYVIGLLVVNAIILAIRL